MLTVTRSIPASIIRGEQVSITTEMECADDEFGRENAGFGLTIKDTKGNCSRLVLNIHQAKRIKSTLAELIEKYDLILEAKSHLVPAEEYA